ncbi:MAG: HNH endonuclease [Chloroflexi bacterium]|nr:HNH endonuclease [Chloroflexota bacterium]
METRPTTSLAEQNFNPQWRPDDPKIGSGACVWHQLQDGSTMQLIPRTLNEAVPHTGGASIIRNLP